MKYKEECPECFGWREDLAYFKDGQKYKYWKCMTCGGVWDDKGNKYNPPKGCAVERKGQAKPNK